MNIIKGLPAVGHYPQAQHQMASGSITDDALLFIARVTAQTVPSYCRLIILYKYIGPIY